ncbi:MAG: phosphoribosylanthranilate isomerase [Fimbriimonadales bacterium]|nr:MAG: N-(5'-phosphoribosyl)anthranilate isomerase [Fimbriimonadales bacterium]
MWVKICGLTNPADAACALEAGADALGFIFVRQSPRYLPAHAPDWEAWLPSLQGATRVLVVSAPDELPDAWELFDVVQCVLPFWSAEAKLQPVAEAALPHSKQIVHWLALRFPPECSSEEILQTLESWQAHAERFVLDTYHPTLLGGTGVAQDWTRLRTVCARAPKPIMLAGGLTPETVADAIRTARPAGVDVSSGVEAAPGRKDPDRVRQFIRNAKTALEGERA